MEDLQIGNFIYGIDTTEREKILQLLATPPLPIFELEFPKQTKFLPAYYILTSCNVSSQHAKNL
jgi:hypothetical protein